jgi:spore germination protein YaaH
MTELRAALPSSKTLYVCVQPDTWFDGYDYRALGELCDKVILMAHDYQWSSIPSYYLGTANTACPVTPFPQIYLALRAITDPDTGVQDRSRLALAISFSSTGFKVDSQGKLLSLSFYNPNPATIITRLRQAGTVFDYSETYRNPDIYYTTEDGCRYRLWYEDERSVSDKIKLAEMFGITGISLWRLGNVPDYGDPGLYYDVWDEILSLSAKQAD